MPFCQQEEAQHVRDGDYTAARDDASRAADAQGWSDYRAGGEDHTGQAQAEADKEDWAVWHEQQASEAGQNAEWYAAHGDANAAESYQQSADQQQEWADQYGHEGERGAVGAVYDPSSETAHDTPVGEDSYADHSVDAGSGASEDYSAASSSDYSADTSSSYDSGGSDTSDM